MGDVPENGPNRSHTSAALDGMELFWIRDFARYWQQFSLDDRKTFVELIVWCQELRASMKKKADAEANETVTRRWKIGAVIATAGLLFTGLNALVEYTVAASASHQAAAPQKIEVTLPNGQTFTVTPVPSPTSEVPQP